MRSLADWMSLHSRQVKDYSTLIQRSELARELDAQVMSLPGRRRANPPSALLAVMMLSIDYSDGSSAFATKAALVAEALTPKQRRKIGLVAPVDKAQIYRLFRQIDKRSRVHDASGEVPHGCFTFSVAELVNDLIRASVPDQMPSSTEFAVDATDVETYVSQYRMREFCPLGQDHDRESCEDHAVAWDPDVRWGRRTPTQNKEEFYVGYAAHLATDLPPIGHSGKHTPLIRGLHLTPAQGGLTPQQGIAVVDELRTAGFTVDRVIADRGYTFAVKERWADELKARGITQALDLHQAQVGPQPTPKTLPGTTFIDGALFSLGMPPHLLRLRRVGRHQGSAAHAARVLEFDERAKYAFVPFDAAGRRFRGPAVKGRERVRCVNAPHSMKHTHLPLTNCRPGKPCSCAKTVTLDDPQPALRQHFLWGTSDWESDYGRRTFIETANSYIKTQILKIHRESLHMTGLHKTTLLYGLLCAVANMRVIRSVYGIGLSSKNIPEGLRPITHVNTAGVGKNRHTFAPRKPKAPPPPPPRGSAASLPPAMQAPPVLRTTEQP